MKLGPVTKLEKKNTSTSKRIDDGVISENFEIIVFFPIYGQISAIRKLDSGRMVYKTDIFSNGTTYLTNQENS